MSSSIEVSDYLLGELSGEELAEAERLMHEDPDFRAQVERLAPVVGHLDELPEEAWQQSDPPPLPSLTDRGTPDPAPKRAWWPRELVLRPAFASVAAVVLIALGIGVGLLVSDVGSPGGDGTSVALEPVVPAEGQANGSATFVSDPDGEPAEIEVAISDLDPSAPSEHYELWLLTSPNDLVSLGSFRVPDSGTAEFRVPVPVDPGEFQFVDISLEDNDGDASHSGRSILRAPT